MRSHIGPHEQSSRRASRTATIPRTRQIPTTTLLRYEIPGYTTYDGAIGVSKDNWTASLNANNFTNVYGPSNISSGQFIKSEIPLRPRVITFLFGYRF